MRTATTPPAKPTLIACLPWACRVGRQVGGSAGPAGAGIEDDLVGAAEHTLHGLEIEPLARDFRGLFVLVVDLEEARRLTGRLGDGLLAIGLGGLGDLRGAPTRLRHQDR